MTWQKAEIIRTESASDDIRSIVVRPQEWKPFMAGQHFSLRIPGSDISRKYSIVSPPDRVGEMEFGVQILRNGMLSPKLWTLKPGEEIELLGPSGSSFVWDPSMRGPIVLIGAGCGITPLLSILDSFKMHYPSGDIRMIMSARNETRLMRYSSIKDFACIRFTDREPRIDLAYLSECMSDVAFEPSLKIYVCGPEGFIDTVVDSLLEMGVSDQKICSEKFT